MKFLRLIVFVVSGACACLAYAGDFRAGTYALRDAGVASSSKLTFYKATENESSYRVKGFIDAGIEALKLEVDGIYDPDSNLLRASAQTSDGVKISIVEGSWHASEASFYVSTQGAPPIKLSYAGSVALSATATFEVNIAKAVPGQPLEGAVTIKTTGVLQPYDAQIIVVFAERISDQKRINTRVTSGTELIFHFSADAPLTVPGGLNRSTLRILLVPKEDLSVGMSPMTECGIDLDLVDDKIYVKQASLIGDGGTVFSNTMLKMDLGFTLEHLPTYKGNPAGRRVFWQIAFIPQSGGEPVRATTESLATSYAAYGIPLGTFAVLNVPPLRPGHYRVVYEMSGADIVPYRGECNITAIRDPSDPANKKVVKAGRLSLNLNLNQFTAKVAELIKLNVTYSMKGGEDRRNVTEIVRILGPNGAEVAITQRSTTIDVGGIRQRLFHIKLPESGTYTVEAQIEVENTGKSRTTRTISIVNHTGTQLPKKVPKDEVLRDAGDARAELTALPSCKAIEQHRWNHRTLAGVVGSSLGTSDPSQHRSNDTHLVNANCILSQAIARLLAFSASFKITGKEPQVLWDEFRAAIEVKK